MEQTLQLDIPLLLPHVEDERDQCVARLTERLGGQRGIAQAHVEQNGAGAMLCLHYNPNLVSLEGVRRLAEEAGAAVTRRYRHETLPITGMDCTDCARSIEHIVGRTEGVLRVAVNYAAEKVRLEYDSSRVTHEAIVGRIQQLGYVVDEPEAQNWVRQNWELVLSLLSGLLLAVGFIGETFLGLPAPVALGIYILAYIAGGFDAARHALQAARHLQLDIDVLMVVAALGAAALGEWAEGALLLFLFSLGHALEHYAMDRARHAIEALGQLTPRTARVQRESQEQEIRVEDVLRGDRVIVRPGERIPVDGAVIQGRSAVDQSPITGESVPVDKEVGAAVFAGTVNGEGALTIAVTKLAKDTTLARVVQMVAEAQTQKSPTQQLTERFERVFVPVVLGLVVLVIVAPPLLGWLPWGEAFLRAMTMLVAASPCALAIATPSAILAGVAQAARNGVLIKGGVHLENLGTLEAIALDKTGTITYGRPAVTDVVPLADLTPAELLAVAAAVETRSAHPLAEAIVRHAQAERLLLAEAGELQSITGRGVRAMLDGQVVTIGSLKLFTAAADSAVPEPVARTVAELEAAGKTTIVVRRGDQFLGVLGLADQPRPTANATLAQLRQLGIRHLVMLTGDNARVAARIAQTVGLTEYEAELLPEQKVTAIQKLRARYGQVAMIGDGVNDAPALTQATVGIAMGAGGSDVALETADVALMADDLGKLPFAVALSRQARTIIRQNLVISLGVIAMLLPSALLGIAGIGIAIVFHEGSTLLVVANALRLLRFAAPRATGQGEQAPAPARA